MNEVIERFLSGYCKADNKIRRVLCELSVTENGLCLDTVDCGHDKCEHATGCDLMKAALALEDE